MKKLLIALLITLIPFTYVNAQDGYLSGPKPIIKILDNTTGEYVNQDPANNGVNQLGCSIGTYNFRATWTNVGSSDEYRVESTPYAPRAYLRNAFGNLTPPVNGEILTPAIIQDDYWSVSNDLSSPDNNGVDVDLNFCYFGNARNQFIINENGAVSFDLTKAGQHDGPSWQFPSMGKISTDANLNPFNESIIMGLDTYYQDSSSLPDTYSFWDIVGGIEDRYFILGYHHLPLYSTNAGCGNTYGYATMQMVFYETTNIIEFHIQDKPLCYSWAGSKFSAMGIQNDGLTKGYAAPGRDNLDYYQILDLTDGFYDSNINTDPDPEFGNLHPPVPSESWRIIPDGVLGTPQTFQWYTNYDHVTETGTVFGPADTEDLSIDVQYMLDEGITSIVYTAVVTYTDYCTGAITNSAKDITFELDNPFLMHTKEQNSADDDIEFEDVEQINLCVGDDYDLEAWIQNYNNLAISPDDFTTSNGTLNFNGTNGETQTITIPINEDLLIEPMENFSVFLNNLSTNAITIADNTGVGYIIDNDIKTGVSINDVTVNEANGTIDYSVSLKGDVAGGFTIDYTTSNDSAVAPADYTATNGTLIFVGTDGEVQNFSVPIIDDATSEPTENFITTLSNLSTALTTIADNIGVGTILDNDTTLVNGLSINDVTVNEEDGTMTFVVTLTGVVAGGFSVDYTIANSPITFQWTVQQFPTPATNIGTNQVYSITNAVEGTYIYEVSATHDDTVNGGQICNTSDRVEVTVSIDNVTFNIPAPTTFCASENDPPIQQYGTPAGGFFTIDNGGIFVNPVAGTNPIESLDGLVDLSVSGLGDDTTGVFNISYTAGCMATTVQQTITIIDAPILVQPPTSLTTLCATNVAANTAEFDTAAIEAAILNNVTGFTLLYEYDNGGVPVAVASLPNPFTTTSLSNIKLTASIPGAPASCTSEIFFDLVVSPKPVAGTPTNNLVLCESPFLNDGEAAFDGNYINNTILNGLSGANYVINYVGDINGTAVPMPSPLPASYVASSMTVTAFIDNTNSSCDSDPITFDLIVREIPEVSPIINDLVVCETNVVNHTASFDTSTWDATILATNPQPVNTDFIIEYTYNDGTGSVTVNAIPNPLISGSQTISVISRNVTAGQQTCSSSIVTFSLVVNPQPVGTNQTPTTCSDVAINMDIDSFTTGVGNTYSWVAVDNTNVTGETLAGSSSTITDTLTNTSGVNQTVIYTITPTGLNTCVGSDYTVSVTVQPEPVGTSDVAPACSNIAVNIDINTFVTGVGNTYTWVATDNTNITGETLANSTAGFITDTLINTSTTAQDVIYTVTPTGANGCDGDSFTITVNVGEEPVGTNTPEIACSDVAVNFDLNNYTTLTGNTYSWVATDNGSVTGETLVASSAGAITDTLTNTSTVPQAVVYTITPTSANGCVGNDFTVTITVNEEPVGTNSPSTICSDVAMAVDLNGFTTLVGNTYSWVATDNANVTGETIASTAGATLTDTLNNVSGVDQVVLYTVTPTSANGCLGNDFTVSVTVQPEPVGTSDVAPACSNIAVNIDINTFVTGVGNTYTWVATDNTNITGETLANSTAGFITDTLINTSTTAQDVIYTVTPTGANGCDGDSFTITVNVGEEPVGTNTPEIACSDVAVNFDLNNYTTLTGNTYSWVATDNGSVTGETLVASSAGTITDTLTNTSTVPQAVVYTITPTSANGCAGSNFIVTITINPEPVGTSTPEGTCSDVALNLDLSTYVTGTGNTFSWVATDNTSITGETLTTSSTAVIIDTLNNVSGASQDVIYTVTPTSANGCEGNSFLITVTVGDEPLGTDTPETTCSDEVLNLALDGYTNSIGNTYSWIAIDNPNVTGETVIAATTTSITDTLNNVSGVAQDVVYTITPAAGCMGNPFIVTVTVNPEPVGTFAQENACSNVAVAIDLNTHTTLTGNSYSWTAVDNGNVSGETLISTNASITDTLINTSGVVQTVIYTITPRSANNCVGNPFNIEVQVGFEPVGTNQTPIVCSDDLLNLDLESFTSQTNNTFSWVASDNINVTNETTTVSTTAFITDTLNNVSNFLQTVTYTITPTSANGCEGTPFTVLVTVNPEPVGVDTQEGACSDIPLNLSLTNFTTLGDTYTWSANDNPDVTGETTTVSTATFITDTLTNLSGAAQIVDYTITVTSADGCIGNPFVISVSVGEEPVGTPQTVPACSDSVLNEDLDNFTSLIGNSYTWVATDNANVTGETTVDTTGNFITDTLNNVSGMVQNVDYTITPTSANGCLGNSFIITIEVGFEPVGTDTSETVCNDEIMNFDLSNYTTLTGNTYTWAAIDNTNVTGETTTSTDTSFITDTVTNTTGVVQTVDYLIIPTSAGGCIGDSFTLSVAINPRPQFVLNSQYYICPETQIATVGEADNPTDLSYEWFIATDMTTPIGFDLTLDVTEADIIANGGAYALTATDANGCEYSQFTSISMAEQMQITNIYVNDFNRPDNTITIEVTGGSGNFEYTLTDEDGNTTTQTSNEFTNVLAGTFEIEVIDVDGCSITQLQNNIYVLDYPAFFTPNGDLNYDTWQITGSHLIPNSTIYIFDRFGKVLAQIDPNSVVGWDGLYNGKQMPASDYWFTAEYMDPNTQEQKIVKGHFSIVRR